MFVAVRKYRVRRGSAAEWARRVRAGFVPLMRDLEGFQGYYLLDGGEDVLITVSMFDSADAALVSNAKASRLGETQRFGVRPRNARSDGRRCPRRGGQVARTSRVRRVSESRGLLCAQVGRTVTSTAVHKADHGGTMGSQSAIPSNSRVGLRCRRRLGSPFKIGATANSANTIRLLGPTPASQNARRYVVALYSAEISFPV